MNSGRLFVFALITGSLFVSSAAGQQDNDAMHGPRKWLGFAANVNEAGYRKTDFFTPHYNIGVFQWDSRIEFWLPPFRNKFSWGLYGKLAGIAQSKTEAYPNAWLGGPGVGLQAYPFSTTHFQEPTSKVGELFGPLRFFAEYNRISFAGAENIWRPRSQSRIGFEYWKAVNVNEPSRYWWLEVWNGLYWQSSNEITNRYDSVIFANAWRSGIRKPHSGVVSSITPYLAFESSRTKYDFNGTKNCGRDSPNAGPNPCNYWWENGLLLGGGLRVAPPLPNLLQKGVQLNRFVVYGEYLNTVTYYGPGAPSPTPRSDVRVGISVSFGDWYRRSGSDSN